MAKQFKYIFLALVLLTFSAQARNKHAQPTELPLTEKEQELFTYFFYDAQQCFELGQYDQCILELEYCTKLNPNDAETHSMLGLLYSSMKADTFALPHIKQAVQLAPNIWRYRQYYATWLYGHDRIKETIALIEQGAKIDPDNTEIWSLLARLYSRQGQYKDAIKALNQVERLEGLAANIIYEKYRNYHALGNERKAISEIERYIAEYPDDYYFQCFRGNLYMQEGKSADAVSIFQKVITEHPENPYVYISLANYYELIGKKDSATQFTIDALQSEQLDLNSKLEILESNSALFERNDINIEPLLLNLIEQYPLEAATHQYYAQYLFNHNRQDELIETLLTITDIDPSNPQPWQRLIDLAISNNNDSLFREITNKAIEHQPDDPTWYLYKSLVLARDSLIDEASQTIQHGISIATDKDLSVKLALLRQLGDIYMLKDQIDSAFYAYEQVIQLNPSDYYTLNNYAYTLAINGGDLRKAEKMSAKTIEAEPTNATYLDTYAWILYLQGNTTLAKFYIQRAKEYAKPDADNTEIIEHFNKIMNQ